MASKLLTDDTDVIRIIVKDLSKHPFSMDQLGSLVNTHNNSISVYNTYLCCTFIQRRLIRRKPLEFVDQSGAGNDDDPSFEGCHLEYTSFEL